MRKTFPAAVAPTAPPAASTSGRVVAHELAVRQAQATSAGVVALLVIGAAVYGWVSLDSGWPLLALALVPPLVSYAYSLWMDLDAERRRLYAQEVEDNTDHNQDTFIGDPFNNVRVQGQDDTTEDVIIPKPSNSATNQPIMQGWGVSAADLVAFAFEAETARGLQERAWVGKGVTQFVMPSGKAVTQKRLRELQEALSEHGMASKHDGKWRLDWTAQRIAEHLRKG